MKKLVLPVLMLMTLNCFANEKGNGGDVIVCFGSPKANEIATQAKLNMIRGIYPFSDEVKPHIKNVELLDFYEYTGVKLIDSNGTADEIFNERMGILSEVVPYYAQIIQANYKVLEFNFYRSLPQIYDEGVMPNVPANCLVAQVAIQKKTNVLVDTYLYSKLDEVNKAGLKFHEALYRFAIRWGHKTSYGVRMLNNKLFRDSLASADQFEIYDYFQRSELRAHVLVTQGDFIYNHDQSRHDLSIISDLPTSKMIIPKDSHFYKPYNDNRYIFELSRDAQYSHKDSTSIIPKGSKVFAEKQGEQFILQSMTFASPIVVGEFSISRVDSFNTDGAFEKVELAAKVVLEDFSIGDTEVTLNDDLKIVKATKILLKDYSSEFPDWYARGKTEYFDQGLCFDAILVNHKLNQCTLKEKNNDSIIRLCRLESCATFGKVYKEKSGYFYLATTVKMVKSSSGYDFTFDQKGVSINHRSFNIENDRLRRDHICKTGRMSVVNNSFVCVK